jgi:hypothetical protein
VFREVSATYDTAMIAADTTANEVNAFTSIVFGTAQFGVLLLPDVPHGV